MLFKAYINGKEIRDQDLLKAVNPDEITIFESLRVYGGVVFCFDEHLARLKESARACGAELPSEAVLKEEITAAVKTHGKADGFIRMNVLSGKICVMIGERRHQPAIFETGADLKTSSFRAPSPKVTDAQAKTGNYRLQLLSGKPEGAFEWLFLDENHYLTEARVGNFFTVKKGALFTAPASAVLRGITRDVVIECARDLGLFVQETPLTRHEAFNADEAFLTNTSWEILPVRSLDGRLIRTPVPGPVTLKLINSFHRKVKNECQPQKPSIRKLNARSSRSPTKKG